MLVISTGPEDREVSVARQDRLLKSSAARAGTGRSEPLEVLNTATEVRRHL